MGIDVQIKVPDVVVSPGGPVAPVGPGPVVTPPAPTTPVTGAKQIRAALFVDAKGCALQMACNSGFSGPLAWAQSHGHSGEDAYREWLLDAVQATGADTMPYIVDSYFGDPQTSVIAMCLADMGHPTDGHHADQAEGWYDRCIAHGITRQIAILRDSPTTNTPATRQSCERLVAYYRGSRLDVIYLTGLESNRNRTVAQTAQDARWLMELDPGKRVVAGSADPQYLLDIAAAAPGVELWLEQPESLMAHLMTSAGMGTYCMSLNKLALKVGAAKVWAGEWCAKTIAERKEFTKTLLEAGYNVGGSFQA